MKDWLPFTVAPIALLGAAVPGYAAAYFTVEQAQKALFPGASFTPAPRTLTPEQVKAIESAIKARVRVKELKAWKVGGGGWFFVDEVVGKHEFITYAAGLTAGGAVKG